jgi:hypothetical protein
MRVREDMDRTMTIFEARGRPAAVVFLARAALVQKLADCRKVAADTARLACYDAAAAALDTAEQKGEVVVVEREKAEKVRKQAFGFAMPSLSIFDRGQPAEAVDTVTLTVETARRGGDGKWVVRLEGGQVWRQIDTAELSRDPRAGASVTIKRASLGSYKLSTGGAAAIRVHRDE